jgi:hypothetical protein
MKSFRPGHEFKNFCAMRNLERGHSFHQLQLLCTSRSADLAAQYTEIDALRYVCWKRYNLARFSARASRRKLTLIALHTKLGIRFTSHESKIDSTNSNFGACCGSGLMHSAASTLRFGCCSARIAEI